MRLIVTLLCQLNGFKQPNTPQSTDDRVLALAQVTNWVKHQEKSSLLHTDDLLRPMRARSSHGQTVAVAIDFDHPPP